MNIARPIAVGKPHVDDREGGSTFADCRETFGDRMRGGHGKAARPHAAAKAREEEVLSSSTIKRRAIWPRNRPAHLDLRSGFHAVTELGGGVFIANRLSLNHFQDKTRQSKKRSTNLSRFP